jgi:hypothetical protein
MNAEVRGPVLPWPLDVAVFAPLGVAANLFDPKPAPGPACVERGRHEVDVLLERAERALQTAHGTGRLAVTFGVPMVQRSLADRIARIRGEQATVVTVTEPSEATWPAPTPEPAPVAESSHAPDAETSVQPHPVAPDAGALAIPGYDTLSASQVVERLAGLAASDLGAVRAYEVANRNRRTILGKIDQLLAAE